MKRARLFFALVLAALSTSAYASRTVISAVMDYGNQTNVTAITVPPSATISTDVTVSHPTGGGGGSRWRATSYRIGAGATVCVDHADFDAAGTDTVTFTMTAPAAAGTYSVAFIAYADSACTNSPSATFTLTNGITVSTADNSTVVASPTSVAADGTSTSTITVTLLDSGGAPRVSKTVTLSALSGSSVISPPSAVSNASGVVTFSVRDTVAESVTYRARNTTDGTTIAQTPTVTFTAPPSVTGFNAVEPGANATSGKLYTKVAGASFAMDLIALQGGSVNTAFVGTVAVEIVDNTSNGACASLPVIGALANQTFTLANAGRHPLSAGNTIADAYKNAKVRIKYPAVAPTIVACSGDNFAIRPNALVVFSVTDANRTSAGTTNALTNTALSPPASSGGIVHNAGRPFTIRATAYNAAATPAVTTNYDGTPDRLLTACAGTACPATTGTLTLGTWSASSGTVTTTSASYDDVGAFTLQLVDTTYAAVDNGDGTPAAQLTISSGPVDVGRFVPDRFLVSATSVTPRSDIVACAASTFNYMAERIDAVFTMTAVKYPSGTTSRYTGSLARLDLSTAASFGFGAIDTAAPTLLTSRIDNTLGASGTWSNGVANVTAHVALQRGGSPDGPYSALKLGIAPTDPDSVAADPTLFTIDADNNGTPERVQIGGSTVVRFGRLRLQNAYGSQLIAMPLRVEAQYWNGTAFVRNSDDSCTPLAAVNIALGNFQKTLNSGETTVSVVTPITSGAGMLRLSAPGATNAGSVDVALNLSAASVGASCTAGMPSSTGASLTYLQGAWCGSSYTRDPTARATFGVYRNNSAVVYQRENY